MNLITQSYRRPPHPDEDNFLATMSPDYDLRSAVATAGVEVNLSDFLEAHPSGRAPIWALRDNSIGRRIWRRMASDDLVIFYGHNEIYASGFVSAKVHWPNNNHVWPTGEDWDWIYSLRDVHLISSGERRPTTLLDDVLPNFARQPTQLHGLKALDITQLQRLADAANPRPLKSPVEVGAESRPDEDRVWVERHWVERYLRSKTHGVWYLLMALSRHAESRGWKPLPNACAPFLVLERKDVKLLVEAKEVRANPLPAAIEVIGQLAVYEYLCHPDGTAHKVALFESPIDDRLRPTCEVLHLRNVVRG